MIKLLLFAPCENIIVADDGKSSLISVLETITLSGMLTGDLPEEAGFPFRWWVTALWNRTEDVPEPVTHLVKVELFAPNGIVTVAAMTEVVVSNEHANFRNNYNFPIFPIKQAGIYTLRLSLQVKESPEWDVKGEYPIRLVHELQEDQK